VPTEMSDQHMISGRGMSSVNAVIVRQETHENHGTNGTRQMCLLYFSFSLFKLYLQKDGTQTVQVTPLRRTLASFPNLNVLVGVSKDMQAYGANKFCSS